MKILLFLNNNYNGNYSTSFKLKKIRGSRKVRKEVSLSIAKFRKVSEKAEKKVMQPLSSCL